MVLWKVIIWCGRRVKAGDWRVVRMERRPSSSIRREPVGGEVLGLGGGTECVRGVLGRLSWEGGKGCRGWAGWRCGG